MNFKMIAVLLLFAGAVSIFCQGRETKDTKDSVNNSLIKRKLAFQYDMGYDFASESIIPIVFSLKYHLSDKTALRLGVGFIPGEEGPGRRHMNDTLRNFENFDHHENNPEQLNFTLNYMFYPAPKADVNLFFGLGPRFGFGEEQFGNPPNGPENVENDSNEERINNSWSIGLSGVIGAEWFAARSISFFTEYDAAFSYRQRNYWDFDHNLPPDPNNMMENESSEFLFTDISARIGFSIYFDSPF